MSKKVLAIWPLEAKELLSQLIAKGYSTPEAAKIVKAEFEGLHRYTRQTINGWPRSLEGQTMIAKYSEEIRSKIESRPLYHKENRADTLIDVAVDILGRIRGFPKDKEHVTKFVSLCAEFRQSVAEIRKELADLSESDEVVLGLFEKFNQMTAQAAKTKAGDKSLLGEEWTTETESN